jgi:hypothetical protein
VFFFYVWVLFICLQVSVFDGYSSMQRQECAGFGDGTSSLLHIDGFYGECESCLLMMVATVVF